MLLDGSWNAIGLVLDCYGIVLDCIKEHWIAIGLIAIELLLSCYSIAIGMLVDCYINGIKLTWRVLKCS